MGIGYHDRGNFFIFFQFSSFNEFSNFLNFLAEMERGDHILSFNISFVKIKNTCWQETKINKKSKEKHHFLCNFQ